MRLEQQKYVEAEQRLQYYFARKPHDPTYTYPDKQADTEFVRRKIREGRAAPDRRKVG